MHRHGVSIAVVVMVFNKISFLAECLNSVFSQSEAPDQLLIWDAGSTDGSREYLNKQDTTKSTIIFAHENLGVSLDKNRALLQCTTDYVVFLDADDSWETDFILKFRSSISTDKLPDIISTSYEVVTPRATSCISRPTRHPADNNITYYLKARMSGWGLHTSSTILLRKSLLGIGGFPFAYYSPLHDTTYSINLLGQTLNSVPGNCGYKSRSTRIDWSLLHSVGLSKHISAPTSKDDLILLPGGHGEDQYVHDCLATFGSFIHIDTVLARWRNVSDEQMSASYLQSIHFDLLVAFYLSQQFPCMWSSAYLLFVFAGIQRRYSRLPYNQYFMPFFRSLNCCREYKHSITLNSILVILQSSGYYLSRILSYALASVFKVIAFKARLPLFSLH